MAAKTNLKKINQDVEEIDALIEQDIEDSTPPTVEQIDKHSNQDVKETSADRNKKLLTLDPQLRKIEIPDGEYEVEFNTPKGHKQRFNALIGETFIKKLNRKHPKIKAVTKIA